jgi:hypothetical protein
MTSLMSSGSSRADIAVEPTRSQNMTASCRRSATSGDHRADLGIVGFAGALSRQDLRSP